MKYREAQQAILSSCQQFRRGLITVPETLDRITKIVNLYISENSDQSIDSLIASEQKLYKYAFKRLTDEINKLTRG